MRTKQPTPDYQDSERFPANHAFADDEANSHPVVMEGSGNFVLTTTPQTLIDLEETALNRKMLGLRGWEYLTVGLVVVVVTGIGGAVAIVCKDCRGLFERRSEKDKRQNQNVVIEDTC